MDDDRYHQAAAAAEGQQVADGTRVEDLEGIACGALAVLGCGY